MLPFLALLTALPLGCQAPFEEDRHDLASFRIAGVSGETDAAGTTRLRAAVWSGLGAWHDLPPDLAWSSEAGDEALGQDAALAFEIPGSVNLTASAAEGSAASGSETARLDLAAGATPPSVDGFVRQAVDLDISRIGLSIEERQAIEPGEDAPVPVGGAVRLTLGVADGMTVHWMGSGGQFAELDYRTTDWFAGTAVFDSDNEVESTETIEPGIYTLLALVLDGTGNNAWFWLDVAVDVEGPFLYTNGRILALEPAWSAPTVRGSFGATVAEADSTAGITLTGVTEVEDASGSPELCGNEAGVVFDFGPVVEGWCGRSDVVGETVVLDGEVR